MAKDASNGTRRQLAMAGGAAAGFLRQYGYTGEITLIGAEPYLPYQRPPLSKAWLKGEASLDDLYLRSENFYPDQAITTRLETRCEAIDLSGHAAARLPSGERIVYDHLILATGSKARPCAIPGAGQVPHHVLRTLDDAETLKGALVAGRRRIGLDRAG